MEGVILHIPHSGTKIPSDYRNDILLSDSELEKEVAYLADSAMDELFTSDVPEAQTIISSSSRLLCDMERFASDEDEPMAKVGMGAVYTKTASGGMLRKFDFYKREIIMNQFYHPYHKKFPCLYKSN